MKDAITLQRLSTTSLLMLLVFVVSLLPSRAHAELCSDIFSGGVTSWASNGKVNFGVDSKIENSGSVLDIKIGSNNSQASCGNNGNCRSSGNHTEKMNPRSFSNSPYSSDVYVSANGSGTIRQGYYDDLVLYQGARLRIRDNNRWTAFDYVDLGNNATLTLDEGIYWFSYLEMASNSRIAANGNDKITILVETFDLASNIRMNWAGQPEQLAIIAYGDINFSKDTLLKGFVHSKGNINLNQNGKFQGALNANNVTLGNNTIVTYEADAVVDSPFYDLCDNDDGLPPPLNYWSMDMCAAPSGARSVIDQQGVTNADALGAFSVDFEGKYCQAVSFNGNKDYIDIPYNSNQKIAEGSISMWINTDDLRYTKNRSSGHMTLFSRDENGYSNGGHLTIWLTDNGGIVVRHQSTNRSYYIYSRSYVREKRWHHIAYTWGSQGMRLYIDGIYRGLNGRFTGGLGNSQLPIALGASSWQYKPSSNTPRKDQLKDFYKGKMDEVRLYDTQLNYTQIERLHKLDSQTCLNCFGEPLLVSHWSFDVCSTTTGEIVDVVGGSNGLIVNGVTADLNGRFCQAVYLDGRKSYLSIPHTQDMEIGSGAISMWFKVDNLWHASSQRDGGNALLSKDNTGFEDGGHLTMRVLSDGSIKVRHQSTNQSTEIQTRARVVDADRWHHLVYSFGSQGVQIFVDGRLVKSNSSWTTGLNNNKEYLVLGASAQVNVDNEVQTERLHDFFKGNIDHVKLYNNQPSAADVSEWFNEESGNCISCGVVVANYEFNPVNSGGNSNQVDDESGNGKHATLLTGTKVLTPSNNVSCQALEVPNNTSRSITEGLNTNIDVAQDIGSQGSISFWYKSNTDWQDGNARQLFDATRKGERGDPSSARDKYFFLVKLGNGRLRFGMEDNRDRDFTAETPAYNFPADTWVYITTTWNLATKKANIYVNAQGTTKIIQNTLRNGVLGTLEPLVIGDNTTSYLVNKASPNSANGFFDSIIIYNQAIDTEQVRLDMAQVQSCEQVHHYQIEHPETAVTCAEPEIVVKACANASCSQLYDQQVSVELTPNSWVNGNAQSFVGDRLFTLVNRSPGTTTIGITAAIPAAPIVCQPDCTIEYADAGFEFFNTLTGNNDFDLIKLVAQDPLVEVGIKAVANNNGTCEALSNGALNIDLTYECKTSSQFPYSSSQCKVPFAGIPLSNGPRHSGSIALNLDANGEADLGAYRYNDAGLFAISVGATINGAVIEPNEVTLKIVPAALMLNASNDNPKIAGKDTTISLSAVGSLGSVLPNYQSAELKGNLTQVLPIESGAARAVLNMNNIVQLTSSKDDSYVSVNTPTFINGIFEAEQSNIDEVGTYTLSFVDNNYLNQTIEAEPVDLGRVIPAYFDVTQNGTAAFTDVCSDQFTYIGQAFGFASAAEPELQITAYNAQGQVTQNYASSHWLLNKTQNDLNAGITFSNASVYSGNIVSNTIGTGPNYQGINAFDGIASMSVRDTELVYNKVVSPTGNDASPFETKVDMRFAENLFTDTDGVCYQRNYPGNCQAFTIRDIGGTEQRYGRVALENTFGPENSPLTVPIFTEYLVNGRWRLNQEDSCTAIGIAKSSGDMRFTHIAQSENNLLSKLTDISASGRLQFGRSDDNDLIVTPMANNGVYMSGSAMLHLVPKDITGNWSQHLNIDWDGDGDIDADDAPSASITFGIFRGNERTINWREVFNQ